MSLWARRGTFSLPPLTRVTFSLPLANDGCPYLPDFGRCGIPRTSTLTVPGATAMSVAGAPTLEPTRAGPNDSPRYPDPDELIVGNSASFPFPRHTIGSILRLLCEEWGTLHKLGARLSESHICQNRPDMGRSSFY